MAVVLTALLVALALLVVVAPSGVGAALTQDGSALLSLKAGFGDPLGRLHNWRAGDSTPCAWIGVTCNASAVVTSLNLAGMNLSGTVSDDIQLLSGLASLNLSSNLLTGPLPLSLANLTSLLSLDISRNGFNGSFPRRGFFRLKMLTTFSGYSNDFTGSLPVEFVHLPDLQHFDLGGSYFEGPIPPEYGAFSSLLYLDLSGNKLNGSIPPELGNLPCIKWLKIGWNQYEGGIPPHLGNLSTLEFLDLASASLTGTIPSSLGKLHNLNTLFLYQNLLSSAIPAELGNLTKLQSLDLSQNWLTGGIPSSLARLQQLRRLGLMYNRLSGEIPVELADLPELRTFQVWNNSLSGSLPQRLGQASALVWVDVSGNRLEGQIPPFLCAGGKLYKLMLFSNKFSGRIPPSLAHCPALWRLRIEDNQLTGGIPRGFGKLPNLTYVDMSRNMLTGGIPYDLTAAPELKLLYVSGNPLGGSIPTGLWKMRSLQKLYASSCNLTDRLSLLANQCPPLIALDLSGNSFTGSIPDNIGQCQKLIYLDLHRNCFDGIIPAEIARLPVLATLDLSHNMLAGPIPNGFQNCTALEALDLSYNNLSGAIPTEGVFKFMNPAMLSGNPGLKLAISGGNSNKARNEEEEKQQQRIEHPLAWSIVGLIFALTLVILALGSSCFYKRYKWYICSKMKCANVAGAWKLTAFQKLNFTVEDILQCLTSSNIVGMGAAGTVYRAETGKGETIAVKKLWRRGEKEAEEKPGRKEIPLGEVEVLGSVRHRNIVRLLGHCSNSETTLLLYEYMPNGSLGELLHGTKGGDGAANLLADWLTRHRIAMGVAQGLSYLHHDCFPVIIHRDVKSNNILLDSSMEARVADFGVAKLIETTQSMSVVAGSYGYIAPEYAYTMQVDEKSDIYSFGVVLLEILTGKRPSEAEYGGGEWSNIVDWARDKSRTCQGLKDLLDSNVGASSLPWVREEMALVLRVALLCTSKSPVDRPSMRDVVTMLSEAQPRRKTTTTTTTTTTTSPVKELPSL